jgi:transposase
VGEVSIIGVDLAKHVFQLHGAAADGRLLIIGASAVVRWARRPASAGRLAPKGSWLAGMLARQPPMLVTVALANKTARIAWALMAKGGVHQAPVPAV